MSTLLHYKSNLRDVFFNLFECQRIQETTLGQGLFAHLDQDTVQTSLTHFEKVAVEELAKSFASADREGVFFDGKGNVTLPKDLKQSMQTFYDGQWHLFSIPESVGGMGMPPSASWASFELLSGSNPTLAYYLFGAFAASVIDELGTPGQKARFVRPALDRLWGGSMVLTEPDAGSDVGAGRTKARHLHDDIWEIQGTKRFITNGDFDSTENILHLVLARPEGADVGTKGLSMFIVPKYWVNEDGTLGERNGVFCTNVEKKMGIKASCTCEVTFGDGIPARGFLVGEVHDGIRQMFHVIEYARMAVGVKSIATLSTGYLNALAFTKERVQGPDLLDAANKHSPRVRIIQHPDVRRMLMHQKAHAEGLRALYLYTAWVQDQVILRGGHRTAEAKPWHLRNDLLLPLVKGYSSEKCYEMLALSLQCFGGSGYVQDYPMEQYIRDQKIDSLYEGTTHIQALDLFFRKIAKDGGNTLQNLLAEAQHMLQDEVGGEALAEERTLLARALSDLEGIFATMLEKVGESLYHVGLQGNRILFALAETVIGWLLLRQSAVAHQQLPTCQDEQDKNFYRSKIATVRYYCREVLPQITLTRKLIEQSRLDLMELPEAYF